MGLSAPAGKPDAVVAEISRVFVKAVTSKDVIDTLAAEGIPTMSSTSAEYQALIAKDIMRLKPIVESLPRQ